MDRLSERALFVDRDGTLIVDLGYPKDAARVTLVPGAAAALALARAGGRRVIVVGNQSGVGRGLLAEDDVWRVHARMEELLAGGGARIDGAYYCFHAPEDGCACRKPSPEMLLRAARDHGIDLGRSLMVGDKASDVDAGRAAGCRAVLLTSPNEQRGWTEVTRVLSEE